jgi:hypothetical protein
VLWSAWRFLAHGGMFMDDWWITAQGLYHYTPERHGFFGTFDGIYELVSSRPLTVPLDAVIVAFAEGHPGRYALVAVLATCCLPLSLYAFLRIGGAPAVPAGVCAAILAAIPFASVLHFWAMGTQAMVSLSLLLLGLGLGALAQRPALRRRRVVALAAASSVVLAASALLYEAGLGLLLLTPVYYAIAARRVSRLALVVTAANAVAVVFALLFLRGTNPAGSAPRELWEEHARVFVREAWWMVKAGAVPDGNWGVAAQVIVALLAVAAVVRFAVLPRAARMPALAALPRPVAIWIGIAVLGGIAGMLGYLALVPSSPWYHPNRPGQGTRANAAAVVGFAIAYGATAVALATVLAAGVRRRGLLVRDAIAAVLAFTMVGAFVGQLRSEGDKYIAQWRAADRLTEQIAATVTTKPEPGTAFLSFGAPGFAAPEISALGESWDLNSAIKLVLRDGRYEAFPVVEGQEVVCGATGVELPANQSRPPTYGESYTRPYGKVVFLDAPRGRSALIASAQDCRRQLRDYKPGPYFVGA